MVHNLHGGVAQLVENGATKLYNYNSTMILRTVRLHHCTTTLLHPPRGLLSAGGTWCPSTTRATPPSLLGGVACPCAALRAALAGWVPRAAPAGPPQRTLTMAVLALSTNLSSWTIGNFPIHHGRFPIKHGCVLIEHGLVPNKHGRFRPGSPVVRRLGAEGVSSIRARACACVSCAYQWTMMLDQSEKFL